MTRPLVSVLVPAFDYGRYLPECLDGVLAQDLEDLEVVIGDNASTDETAAIAQEYVARDARVEHWRHSTNLGYARNVNALLERARGEYVTLLGADDRYLDTGFLRSAVTALGAAPGASFFHSAYQEVDAEGRDLLRIRYYDEPRIERGRDALLSLLGLRYPWISTVVVPREVLTRVGGFDLAYEYAWDLAWFWKLALAGAVAYSPRAMVTYRRHAESLSGSADQSYKHRHVLAALERFRPEVTWDPELTEACDRSRRLLEERLSGTRPATGETDPDVRFAALLDGWRASGARVLVHGAGMHTRLLLERHDLSGVRLVGFADRDPAYRGERLAGLPIVPPNEIAATGAQVVLVSSHFYEDEIVAELTGSLPPTIEVRRLYGADSPRAGSSRRGAASAVD